MMPMWRPTFSPICRTRATRAAWSFAVPCEKLMRNTSVPARISCSRRRRSSVAGPKVATILVRRRTSSLWRRRDQGRSHSTELGLAQYQSEVVNVGSRRTGTQQRSGGVKVTVSVVLRQCLRERQCPVRHPAVTCLAKPMRARVIAVHRRYRRYPPRAHRRPRNRRARARVKRRIPCCGRRGRRLRRARRVFRRPTGSRRACPPGGASSRAARARGRAPALRRRDRRRGGRLR